MVDPDSRDVLGGCEPSSARTQGAVIPGRMGATEDAAMRRFAAAAPPRSESPPQPDVQARVFDLLKLSPEEQRSKFGFLLDALAMGAPPHGGFAMGIERFVALLAGEPDIRQIVAFPKVSSGSDPLTGAPTPMPDAVLAESGIVALPQEDPTTA